MSSIITRLFKDPDAAQAAIADLRSHRLTDVIVWAPGTADVAKLTDAGVPLPAARAYVDAAGETGTLLTIRAPFGHGMDALNILDSHGGEERAVADGYASVIDNAAPLSSLFGWRVLGGGATPLSSFFRFPVLSTNPSSKTELLDEPAPFSRLFGWRILAGGAAPLSSRLGWNVLADEPAPLSKYIGIRVLSNNPAPFSTLFGLPLLLRTRD